MAVLPLGLKPCRVEKFRERRLMDVGESELTEKKKHPQNVRSRSQNERCNKFLFRVFCVERDVKT